MNPRTNPRFSTAVERISDSAARAAVAEGLFSVAPVADLLPGAARREAEVEPAALFVESVAEGTSEGAPE